jgi:hypothetical protein
MTMTTTPQTCLQKAGHLAESAGALAPRALATWEPSA